LSSGNDIRRNDPCPCGSGKKFKRCCLLKASRPPRAPRFEDLIRSTPASSSAVVEAPKFGPLIWGLAGGDEKLRAGLAQVERNAENFVRHYCVPSRLPTPELRRALNAETIHHVWTDLAALQIAYGRRLATMYCDSVDCVGRRRLHLASLALRAYLELTGVLIYFEQRLTRRLVDGVASQAQMDELNELLRVGVLGGRFDWAPFFQGGARMDQLIAAYAKAKDHEHEPAQAVRQKSTGAYIAEVDKHFGKRWPEHQGKVRAVYAMLSDICHPSVGGDLFFAEVPQQPGWVTHRAEPHDEMIKDFVRRVALPVLLDISQITVWSLKRLGQVADSLHEQHDSGEVVRIPPMKDGAP
jgi:hypothetical protein